MRGLRKTYLLFLFIFFIFFLFNFLVQEKSLAQTPAQPHQQQQTEPFILPNNQVCHKWSIDYESGERICEIKNDIIPSQAIDNNNNHNEINITIQQPVDIENLKQRDQNTKELMEELEREREREREKKREREVQKAAAECHSSYGFVSQTACNASLFSPVLIGLIQAFNKADTEGDIQAACKAAKKNNGRALIFGAASYGFCLKGLQGCISKCNKAAQLGDLSAQQKGGDCSQKRTTISLVAIPTMIENTRRVFATKCPNDEDPKAEDTYYCQRFERQLVECKKVRPASSEECVRIERELLECNAGQQEVACADKTGEELQACLEFEEVAGPPKAGVPPSPNVRQSPKKNPLPLDSIAANQFNPDDLLDGLDENGEEDIPIEPEVFNGNEDDPTNPSAPLGVNGNPGGVGGFGGGGGIGGFRGGAGAEGEGEGEEGPYEEEVDPGINPDILGDFSNARGGGSSGFGGGAGAQGFGAKGNKFKGFNLPKNLFGDKKGKAGRNLAGIGGANEITSANGLSNFQKVSRAMNQRRQKEFR